MRKGFTLIEILIVIAIIAQALSRDEIELGGTTPTRDFLYVDDTVRGMMRCAEQPGIEGEVINLGSGQEISVGETVKMILSILGRDTRIVESAGRLRPPNSEVERLIADRSKAQRLLDWRPLVSFDEGLRRTVDWMRRSLAKYKASIYNV